MCIISAASGDVLISASGDVFSGAVGEACLISCRRGTVYHGCCVCCCS